MYNNAILDIIYDIQYLTPWPVLYLGPLILAIPINAEQKLFSMNYLRNNGSLFVTMLNNGGVPRLPNYCIT